jgi:hypothetical protein
LLVNECKIANALSENLNNPEGLHVLLTPSGAGLRSIRYWTPKRLPAVGAKNLSSPKVVKNRANQADSRGVLVMVKPLYWNQNKAPANSGLFLVRKDKPTRNSFAWRNLDVTLLE